MKHPNPNPLPPIEQNQQLSSVPVPKTYSEQPLQPQRPTEPACLHDGSGSSIPWEYFENGGNKVNVSNLHRRLKEVKYTAERLKTAGVAMLLTDPTDYTHDVIYLSEWTHPRSNPVLSIRKAVVETILKAGFVNLLKDLWNALIEQFRTALPPGSSLSGSLSFVLDDSNLLESFSVFAIGVGVLVNATDIREHTLQKELYRQTIDLIFSILESEVVSPSADMEVLDVVDTVLNIVHNFCFNLSSVLPEIRERGMLKLVSGFKSLTVQSDSEENEESRKKLRIIAVKVASYVVTEEYAGTELQVDDDDIAYFVSQLGDSLEAPGYLAEYRADELMSALNQLAVIEVNKIKVVEAGILPLLVKAMKTGDAELELQGTQGLWTISFYGPNKQKIKDEPDCLTELRRLSDNENVKISKAAKGALWNVEGESGHLKGSETSAKVSSKRKHVMISYQHGVKPEVLKLCQRLKQEGFNIWIDVENMSGSTLEAMAEAVENSIAVIPVLTEKYKESNACRQEAEYANVLSKKFLPVLMQPRYRADGWLGLLLSSTYYYDLTKPMPGYEEKIQELLNALHKALEEEGSGLDAVDSAGPTQPNRAPAPSKAGSLPNQESVQSTCYHWTTEQVTAWLEEFGLEEMKSSCGSLDGKHVAELIHFSTEHPDIYCSLVSKGDYQGLSKILKLNAALRPHRPK